MIYMGYIEAQKSCPSSWRIIEYKIVPDWTTWKEVEIDKNSFLGPHSHQNFLLSGPLDEEQKQNNSVTFLQVLIRC